MKRDDVLIIIDTVLATVFGMLGLAALFGAVALGAWHQLVVAALCGSMVWPLVSEVAQLSGKAKNKK